MGVPSFEVLMIRILLFRVLYWGPLFSETPIWACEVTGLGLGFVLQGFGMQGSIVYSLSFKV